MAGEGAGGADTKGGGVAVGGGDEVGVQFFQAAQDVLVAEFAFGGHAFAKNLAAVRVQDHALDLGATEINPDFIFGHNGNFRCRQLIPMCCISKTVRKDAGGLGEKQVRGWGKCSSLLHAVDDKLVGDW